MQDYECLEGGKQLLLSAASKKKNPGVTGSTITYLTDRILTILLHVAAFVFL